MKDFLVLKDSLTKNGDFIKKGTTVSLSDDDSKKLLSLGNIQVVEEVVEDEVKKTKRAKNV